MLQATANSCGLAIYYDVSEHLQSMHARVARESLVVTCVFLKAGLTSRFSGNCTLWSMGGWGELFREFITEWNT